jgi:protein arginine kinase activator
MKCQKCEKPATFHITELVKGKPEELHLCEDHARDYLTTGNGQEEETPTLAGVLAHQMAVGQTAEELSRLDQRACPVCGITFYEFRKNGRLGCPHDYVYFKKPIHDLLLNIHGATQHTGKRPLAWPEETGQLTDVIRLRKEMTKAVEDEQYESASELRDQINEIRKTFGQQEAE